MLSYKFWFAASLLGCFGVNKCWSLVLYSIASQNSSIQAQVIEGRLTWTDRVNELIAYQEEHGDMLVPKRYEKNPALGNWVNKQRQQYKKYRANERPCSLTDERVRILTEIGFCWDASQKKTRRQNDRWFLRLQELQVHGTVRENLPSSLSSWIRTQRKEYQKFLLGEKSQLDNGMISALQDIDPNWWKTTRELMWDKRYQELIDYREKFGDCCVPINFGNRKLANWVSNTRKNYNLKLRGKQSTLSDQQIEKLNDIGFVWNFWDYEYGRKLNDDMP